MSLARYRVIDLILITIVGVVSEIVGCYLINYFMPSVIPIFVASFIICYLAIMRWGVFGIIEIPIMSLATYIAITFVIQFTHLNTGKEQLVQNYWSILAFDSLNVIWVFCKGKNGELLLNSIPKRIGMMFLMYIVGSVLCSLVLTLNQQNFFVSFLRLITQQLLALLITCFVIEILHRLNAIYDVKKSILDRKKEREFETEYYNQKKKE